MKPSGAPNDAASVLLISAEGVVVDAEENACRSLGWTREELLNRPMSDVLEYGHDLLMDTLAQMQVDPSSVSPEGNSISMLVRRSDQTSFPATVAVRSVVELGCFTLTFDDLPNDVCEAAPLLAGSESDVAAAAPVEAEVAPAAEDVLREAPDDAQQAHANANGDGPRFRNVFLNGSARAETKTEEEAPAAKSDVKNDGNGSEDMTALLETERSERRRLEARVLSLNDQLQQLHLQLKSNLESENVYHKRVAECEEEVRKAEEAQAAAEAALAEQQLQRERLEGEFAQLKSAQLKREEERKIWQQEWLAKLETNLNALQESDARFAKEIATRRSIDVTLQMLRQDLSTEFKKQESKAPEARAKNVAAAELLEAAPL